MALAKKTSEVYAVMPDKIIEIRKPMKFLTITYFFVLICHKEKIEVYQSGK